MVDDASSKAENRGHSLTFDIQDGKGLLDVAPNGLRAGGHDNVQAPLILLHMELEHALLSGQLIDALQVDGAQVLNVDGATLQPSKGCTVQRVRTERL